MRGEISHTRQEVVLSLVVFDDKEHTRIRGGCERTLAGMMPCQPKEKPQRRKNASPHPKYSSGANVMTIASTLVP